MNQGGVHPVSPPGLARVGPGICKLVADLHPIKEEAVPGGAAFLFDSFCTPNRL